MKQSSEIFHSCTAQGGGGGGYSGILVTGTCEDLFGFEILGLGLFLGLKFSGGLFFPLRFWRELFLG